DVIISDDEAPVLSACPSDIVECATNEVTQKVEILNIELNPVNYSDNCGGVLTVQYQIKDKDDNILMAFGADADGDASGFEFPEGVNTITYRVIDAANLSSECSFTVTIYEKPNPSGITTDI
ncbi:HYR domain-containing protein, partial [Ancylomarina sp. DW003]